MGGGISPTHIAFYPMIEILRHPNICQVLGEDDVERFKKLDSELSFFIQGAEHTKAYKGYTNELGEDISWDGIHHVMSSSGKFPAGLFNRVIRFYGEYGISPRVIDKRVFSKSSSIDILPRLKQMGKVPRDYQIKTGDLALENDRGIMRLATGSGKTICAALMTAKVNLPTIVYVIGKDLLYQFQELFQDIFQKPIGIIGDGQCEIHDINIATVCSVGRAFGIKEAVTIDDDETLSEAELEPEKAKLIRSMVVNSKLHIFDECHLCSAPVIRIIGDNITGERVFGMSASPWRDDGSDLLIEAMLGDRLIDLSAKYMIERGYLTKPVIRFLSVPKNRFPKKTKYQTVYKHYIVENDQRNNMVCTAATKLTEQNFLTLVLFNSINHGEILYDLISKNISCELLSGKDSKKQRESVKNKLYSGEIKCIIASKIFDIGVDIPILSALINAAGGKSSVRTLQRVGRVIRLADGKTISAVIDFADQSNFVDNHAERRCEILKTEFDVQWPSKK